MWPISMGKKYVTPLLSHWSYVVLALTHWYILHWTVSSLDQTVASLLFGINPLSEPMQTCFQLNHKENVSMKYHLRYNIFSQENVFEYAVWNGNRLVSTEMRFNDNVQCWLKGVNKGERNIHGKLMSHHWSVYCINFEFHGSVNT